MCYSALTQNSHFPGLGAAGTWNRKEERMQTARIGKEAVVQVPNRMGMLTRVARLVSDKGIDIQAVVATVDGTDAIIRLVTDDHQRTMDVLRENNLNPQEARVVVVEVANRPGLLRHIAERLVSENLDLAYLYGSATTAAEKCLVIFASNNNDRAVVVLNE